MSDISLELWQERMRQVPSLESIDVHELLPQQEPFVMIDRLVEISEKTTATQMKVREDNLFVEGDELDACALAENIAQTCAARLGFINKYIFLKGVQLGFIGAIRAMKVESLPHVGDVLDTRIDVLQQIMDLTLVDAIVKVGERVICTAEMKIALADELVGENGGETTSTDYNKKEED